MEHLQAVAEILFGPEQTCAVNGQTIQCNLHLIPTIMEAVKDNHRFALINLDPSKELERVDNLYMAAVLQATGFKFNFCKWTSLLFCSPLWCR